jgi:hypothetical protein
VRDFHTSVVELRQPFTGAVSSEPYECGWADEALFFVTVEEDDPEFETLNLRVQISADGVRWVDEGTTLPVMSGPGVAAAKVRHFGGWLRLIGTLTGRSAAATLSIRLALKG